MHGTFCYKQIPFLLHLWFIAVNFKSPQVVTDIFQYFGHWLVLSEPIIWHKLIFLFHEVHHGYSLFHLGIVLCLESNIGQKIFSFLSSSVTMDRILTSTFIFSSRSQLHLELTESGIWCMLSITLQGGALNHFLVFLPRFSSEHTSSWSRLLKFVGRLDTT